MNCIKSKCIYFTEHQYQMSYGTCTLNDSSYKKDLPSPCYIEDEIKLREKQINKLRRNAEAIRNFNSKN